MSKLRRTETLVACLVAIIIFLVFLPGLQNGFVNWDDEEYIYENPFIRSLNMNLFKSAFFEFHVANYHPLTWLSHALDYAVWGLNPLGHHLTNNVLHAFNALLVVFMTIRLVEIFMKKRSDNRLPKLFLNDRAILIMGGVSGVLFGLHPLHVESVAWISERKDLLCALFFLLSVLSYTRYADTADNQKTFFLRFLDKYYLLTLGFFVLALLSKPMAVTLPLVMLILDWYPFRRIPSSSVSKFVFIEKLPFLILSLISSVITILAQNSGEAIVPLEDSPLGTRSIVGVTDLASYLWKMILPINLMPFYPYPQDVSLLSSQYLLPVLCAAGITAICIAVLKKEKLWLASWSYYVIALLPVLGIIRLGSQSMADRYTYLPSLGPFFILGFVAAWSFEKMNGLMKWRRTLKLIQVAMALVVLASLSFLTIHQIGIWKNGFTLWNYTIAKEPKKIYFAYNNRGLIYSEMGQYAAAIEDYDMSIALKPDFFKAYNNRGVVYNKKGLFDTAIEDFNKAIDLNPGSADAFNNRGVAYDGLGFFDKAMEDFSRSITLNPGSEKAYINRGVAYDKRGFYGRAIEDYTKAIALNQSSYRAYNNRGVVYNKEGSFDKAIEDYTKAIALNPHFSEAYYNRAVSYFKKGMFDKAAEDLHRSRMGNL